MTALDDRSPFDPALDEMQTIGAQAVEFASRFVDDRYTARSHDYDDVDGLLASIAGEMTGCGRYSAACADGLNLLPWLVQPLVVGALLVFPAIADRAAIGSIGALVAGIPVAIILSVTGGGRGPAATTAAPLVMALIVGYAIGLAGAVSGRFRLPGSSATAAPALEAMPAAADHEAAHPRDDSG